MFRQDCRESVFRLSKWKVMFLSALIPNFSASDRFALKALGPFHCLQLPPGNKMF